MFRILRTDSSNKHFVKLVTQLDADLAERDGNEHAFYHQFNSIDTIKHAIVLYEGLEPIGCGAIKEYAPGTMEIKRMFTTVNFRGKGMGTSILLELEKWSKELGYNKCVLETGKRQPEAIALYKKNGYIVTDNYGQYAGVENSVCFEKDIAS